MIQLKIYSHLKLTTTNKRENSPNACYLLGRSEVKGQPWLQQLSGQPGYIRPCLKIKNHLKKIGLVAHTFNTGTQETEKGGPL